MFFENDDLQLMVTITAKNVKSDKLIPFNAGGPKDIPLGGIFVKAKSKAILTSGIEFSYKPKVFKVKILTLSDRASEGIYEDKSGELIIEMVKEFFDNSNRLYDIDKEIIPDDKESLEKLFNESISQKYDIIFTTGGTGIGPRDITPDVISPLLDKQISGIMELIRVKYGMQKPNALISRSIAGVKNQTLVYCLPGSSKGVKEYMTEILPTVFHSIYMLYEIQLH
ncbi:MAG: MogA/MoaB family molybdenum cofactor biosynthesis protein [Saprospiraceae bacterium]